MGVFQEEAAHVESQGKEEIRLERVRLEEVASQKRAELNRAREAAARAEAEAAKGAEGRSLRMQVGGLDARGVSERRGEGEGGTCKGRGKETRDRKANAAMRGKRLSGREEGHCTSSPFAFSFHVPPRMLHRTSPKRSRQLRPTS